MTPEQLIERRNFLGASEAGAACALSPWKTPFQLWSEKIGDAPAEPDNERMQWGRRLERAVMERYIEDATEPVQYPCNPVVHPEFHWMRATPDGLTPTKVVEIKTAGLGQAREWGEAEDAIPLVYLLQVTHAMLCTQRRLADVAVLIAGNDFRTYSLSLDDELAALLIERERAFWRHVEDRTPPDVASIADAVARWPKDVGTSVVATPEVALAVDHLRRIKAEKKLLDTEEKQVGLAIRAHIGDATTLTDPLDGSPLATWKAQRDTKFDEKAFKAAHPDLYASFSSVGSMRVLRLAKENT